MADDELEKTKEVICRGFYECLDIIMETRKSLYHLTDAEAAEMRQEIVSGTYKYDAGEKYKDR